MKPEDFSLFSLLMKVVYEKGLGKPFIDITEGEAETLSNLIQEQTGLTIGGKSLKNYALAVIHGKVNKVNPVLSTLDTLSRYALDISKTDETSRKEEGYKYWVEYRKNSQETSVDGTKRLAAIMFTDIVGYTSLMQEDELKAMRLRKRHREIFEDVTAKYQGEIIQYLGDGTVSIFKSSVAAVRCGIEIQQELHQEPVVPLRIGIHVGDIHQTKVDIIGDSVNLTARVESMGVAGSVLISEKVYDDIKNQTDIEIKSLGTFQFKNVRRPIEVFAVVGDSLVIPASEQIRGKGTLITSKFSETRHIVKWMLYTFIGLMVGIGIWLGLSTAIQKNPEQNNEEDIDVVALMPLVNQTGNPELNILGFYVMQPVKSGLQSFDWVEVVSPDVVRQYIKYAGYLPNNLENQPAFSELTGAKTLLNGSYFLKENDTIVFNIYLSNAETGKIIHGFDEIKEHKDNKRKLSSNIQQQLLGYWLVDKQIKDDFMIVSKYIPDYRAAKSFSNAMRYYLIDDKKALEYSKQAFQFDSLFIHPVSLMVLIYRAWGEEKKIDSLRNIYEPILDKIEEEKLEIFVFPKLLRIYFRRDMQSLYDLNYNGLQNRTQENSIRSTFLYAAIALNRPGSIRFLDEKISPYISNKAYIPLDHNLFARSAYAYSLIGEDLKCLEYLNSYNYIPSFSKSTWLHAMKIRALVRNGQNDAIQLYIESVGKQWLNLGDAPAHLYLQVAWEMALLGKKEEQEKFAQLAFEAYQQLTPEKQNKYKPYSYLLLGDVQMAKEGFYQLLLTSPNDIHYLGRLGMINALQGEFEEAQNYLKQLEKIGNKNYGWKQYWEATIKLHLGKKDEAISLLDQAINKGIRTSFYEGNPYFFWNTFADDIGLLPLFDYKPFQKLIEPEE